MEKSASNRTLEDRCSENTEMFRACLVHLSIGCLMCAVGENKKSSAAFQLLCYRSMLSRSNLYEAMVLTHRVVELRMAEACSEKFYGRK